MPTTYSASLRLSLLDTGENSGTWGNITNDNLGALIEQAITGVQTVAMADSDKVLTPLNGAVDEARNAVITMTGSLSAQRSVIVPFAEKTYVIRNLTTGGQAILVKTATGSGVTIPNGNTATIYCDATDVLRSAPLFNQSTNAVTAATFVGNLVASTGAFTSMPTVGGVSIVPVGVIWMWSGSIATIPSGWALCDGTNSTPDLRDRFVLGAAGGQSPGATGGSFTSTTNSAGAHAHGASTGGHAVTIAEMPAHSHGITDPGHIHGINPPAMTDINGTGVRTTTFDTIYGLNGATELAATNITINSQGSGQAHAHTISSDGAHDHTVTVVPPFYALAFIMKL